MQAVALATGDEFLTSFNFTFDIEDVLDSFLPIIFKWNEPDIQRYAYFDDRYGIEFNLVLGPSGFCYNFNMIHTKQMLNFDR
jgi:hypothetical protein